ncbi:MAG: serine/threonine protein kinase [Planctomycetes bacterium]|nr:serine/threonine protein kinase [Planctomycetota bacterium]
MAQAQEPNADEGTAGGSSYDPAADTVPPAPGSSARPSDSNPDEGPAKGSTILRPTGLRSGSAHEPTPLDSTSGTQEVLLFKDAKTPAREAPQEGSRRGSKTGPGAGKIFGNYEIVEEISRGSFGVVYRARQRGLDRVVALKVLLAGTHASPEAVARFQREAKAAAKLKHAAIVPIYEIGEEGGHHYFAMEFVEGSPLSRLIADKQVSIPMALQIAETLADAMRVAHQAGVIHRDIKPSNIIVDPAGTPHVTDFGLAKQVDLDTQYTQSGTTLGTPAYMPPEQARGEVEKIDARSDGYALGAVLYEMLTGRPPFAGRSLLEVVVAVINEPVRPPRQLNPKIHRDIQTIVMKCLEKDPRNRYASSEELRDDIQRFRSGEAIRARPVGMFRSLGRLVKQNSWFLTAVATVLIAVGVSTWEIQRARQAQQQGEEQLEILKSRLETKPPTWKPIWWFPIADGDELDREDAEQYAQGFQHPRVQMLEKTESGTRTVYPPQNLVSPAARTIIGDFRAKLRLKFDPEGLEHPLRVGLFSTDSQIPFLLEIQSGRLAIVAPVDVHLRANQPGVAATLQAKAERIGPPLSAGIYEVNIAREGLELSFELVWPGEKHKQTLWIWDLGLAHWKFKNALLTIRDMPKDFEVLEAVVQRKVYPQQLDSLTHTLDKFYKGDHNEAEGDLKMIYETVREMEAPEPRELTDAALALYYLGLVQELWHEGGRAADHYYANALDLLRRCPAGDETARIEGQVRLRRLIRATREGSWVNAEPELARLPELAKALARHAPRARGLGEPFGWEMQPLVGAVLAGEEKKETADLALGLFKLMGLEPGSRRLGALAGKLGLQLAAADRVKDLVALHQSFPAGALRPAFLGIVHRLTLQGRHPEAFETLQYAALNFRDETDNKPLEQAGAELLANALRDARFDTARGTLDLLPRPLLVDRLGVVLAERAAELVQHEREPLLRILTVARGVVTPLQPEGQKLAAGVRAYGLALVDGGRPVEVRTLHQAWSDAGLAVVFAKAVQTLAASEAPDAFDAALGLLTYCRTQVAAEHADVSRAAYALAAKAAAYAGERHPQLLKVQQAYPTAELGTLAAKVSEELLRKEQYQPALVFCAKAWWLFPAQRAALRLRAVLAMETMPSAEREKAVVAMDEGVIEQLALESADGRAWRLHRADLLLAGGFVERAATAWRDLRAHPEADPDLRSRAALRLGALDVLGRNGNPTDLGLALENSADLPEEAHVAGRYLAGSYSPQELDEEIRRVGGPSVFNETEWEMLKVMRLVGDQQLPGAAAAFEAAAGKAKEARQWPYALFRLQQMPVEPGSKGALEQ